MGNLTREPECKYTPKGTCVCQIGMAVNRTFKNDAGERVQETTFVDIELWGRTAEVVGDYVKKGDPLHVEGRLKLDQWNDKQTGEARSKLKIVGEEIQLMGSRDRSESGDGGEYRERSKSGRNEKREGTSRRSATPPPRSSGKTTSPPPPKNDPDLNQLDDDIPF